MISIAKIQAAVKASAHNRVRVGRMTVIGTPGTRWEFAYMVARENGRTAYGKRNAEEYARTLDASEPIVPATLDAKTEAANPTIAGYRTGNVRDDGKPQTAYGYSRHGVILFSFVPRLMGYKEPTFADALDILRGESVESAIAEFNVSQAYANLRSVRPDAVEIANAMLCEARDVLKLGTTMVSVPMTQKPAVSFLSGVMNNTRRLMMVDRNRARAAMLRARHAQRDARFTVAYTLLRVRGSTARDAITLVRACPAAMIDQWAHSEDQRDAARRIAVQAAVDELSVYLREEPEQITNPHKAFQSLYGTARITPAFIAATR